MANLKNLYLELAEKIDTNLDEINHIDLWHNQVNFLEEEHAFRGPAVFLAFRTNEVTDLSNNSQQLQMQVTMYLFFETMLESDYDAYNTTGAIEFLDSLTKLHKLFHGTSGENYSEMQRIGFSPVDTGSAQNLYQMPFTCLVNDTSAWDGGNDIVDEDNDGENEWQPFQID